MMHFYGRQIFSLSSIIIVLSSIFVIKNNSCCASTLYKYAPEYDKPTDYSFSYGVKDVHSGDVKHQWEKKEGNTIKGQYSLVEPDGSIRTVDYTADEKSGFNAIIKKSAPLRHHVNYHAKHNYEEEEKEAISHQNVRLVPVEQEHQQLEYKYKELEEETHAEIGQQAQEAEEEEEEEEVQSPDQQYVYLKQEENEESAESQQITHKTKKPAVTITEKYEQNYHPQNHLPSIDWKLLQNNNNHQMEKIIPVDIQAAKIVEINLKNEENFSKQQHPKTSPKDLAVKPSHELTQAELDKFLAEYYASNNNNNNEIVEPQIEQGFKPIRPKIKNPITQPIIPNTFKSNKRPQTTPGLKHYASRNVRNTKRNHHNNANKNQHNIRTEFTRFNKNNNNNKNNGNGYVRYY